MSLKIQKKILRNYAKVLIELNEKGITDKELIYRKIVNEATKIGLKIYIREEELRREYFKCFDCKRYIKKEDQTVVKDEKLLEELSLVHLKQDICDVCDKEQERIFYE